LQEIKITEDQVPEVEAAGPLLPGYQEFWCCSLKKGYAGTVSVLIKNIRN
jgi:exonuclease III